MGCGVVMTVGACVLDGDTVMIGGSKFRRVEGPRLPRPRCRRCGTARWADMPFCAKCGKRFEGDEEEV